MEERSSSRASGTTYHSFNDVELFEPASPPRPPVTYDSHSLQQLEHLQYELQRQQREATARRPPTSANMKRQDSGYESNTPPRQSSISNQQYPAPTRRSSNSSSNGGGGGGGGVRSRFNNRPSLRRAAKTHPVPLARGSNQSLHLVRSTTATQSPAYFHFPTPDPVPLADTTPDRRVQPTPVPSPPPQTTHYWTSDRTRRLEYAAIDAATRGVKGWVMRHLVPDCFVSRENRHVSFEDDSGSVRRYRLELEDEQVEKPCCKDGRRRKGWRFWRRRKVEVNHVY